MSDIDDLMSEDPLKLSDRDIDEIIAYQRQARANREAGIKTKKPEGPKVRITLESLGITKAPSVIKKIDRRI